ncbi:hypothetical protein Goklo_003124 [Gossypium klotzschianum]|uniref:40S ribosomal protein S29 n=1 Tax=Gossypium klotzschianum TaxID=34286 RepID=A0A7J8VWD8_9ROSI|nr:hypothetical protein [Gossypium klotzschianum]
MVTSSLNSPFFNCLEISNKLLFSRVCGNPHAIIRKYGLMCCRQCFRSNAKEIGFIKVSHCYFVDYFFDG